MASIFKRGRDKGKKGSAYCISYDDENGRRRTRKGFTDLGLTQQLAGKLETEVMLKKRGMIDPAHEKIAKRKSGPIKEHLREFKASRSHRTSKHASMTASRVRRIIKGCRIRTLAGIDAEAVRRYLFKIRKKQDLSNRTFNHYVQAIDSFCNWCVETSRLLRNPVIGLPRLNTEEDIRHKRRALTPEEFAALVASARASNEIIQCFDGEQRARIYLSS